MRTAALVRSRCRSIRRFFTIPSADVTKREIRRTAETEAQTTIDPFEMRDWVSPPINYGGHAFGLPEADFPSFLDRGKFLDDITALSP